MLTASSSAEDLARLELEAQGVTSGGYVPRTTASTPATPRESVFSGSLRRSEDGGDPPAYSSIQHPVLRHQSLEKESTPRRSPSAPLHVSFPDKVQAPGTSENGSRSHHQHHHRRRGPEQNGGAAWKRGGSRPGNKRAVCNWKRAKLAVTRKITQDMLGPQRRSALPCHGGRQSCMRCCLIMQQRSLDLPLSYPREQIKAHATH